MMHWCQAGKMLRSATTPIVGDAGASRIDRVGWGRGAFWSITRTDLGLDGEGEAHRAHRQRPGRRIRPPSHANEQFAGPCSGRAARLPCHGGLTLIHSRRRGASWAVSWRANGRRCVWT